MRKSFTGIGVSVWNFNPLSVKTLNIYNFCKKIKSLLLAREKVCLLTVAFLFLFVCSVLLYWRSLAKGSSGQTPIGHLRVKKTLTFKPEAFLVKTNFICMRMKNHFHINDYALSLALKQRLGTIRKWLIEIVTLLFIGYDEVA